MKTVWMTKEYQMISDCKSQREGRTTLTTQNRQLMKKKNGVSGIITIKPHRVDDRQWDCIDFIIMAVLDRNNDMIYK